MRITTENSWRNEMIFISIILMLSGLFISRAALSVSAILFLAATLLHQKFLLQLKTFSKNLFLVGISVLFFIPFFSGLWSSDLKEWSEIVRIKLPLLFFPIAFAGNWKLTPKQWNSIAAVFLSIVFIACCWSLLQYIQNIKAVHEGYLKAKVITTPFENDHVRFSWLVSVAIICCVLLIEQKRGQKLICITLIFLSFFFIFYLHILSARTGLFSFYIFLMLLTVRLIKNRDFKRSAALVTLLIALPLLAWITLPTFQNRVKYFLYDISYAKKNTYLPGSNDGVRLLSIKAGWQVLKENPLGAGAGDLRHEADKWYGANVPSILESDKFSPCSEWLMYGGFAGWPGVLLLTIILLLPILKPVKSNKFFWVSLQVIAAFSFAFDMGLEGQYGVFLYAFIILWWWKWFKIKDHFLS